MKTFDEILQHADQILFNGELNHCSIDKNVANKKWRIFDSDDDLLSDLGEFETIQEAYSALEKVTQSSKNDFEEK